MAVVKLDRNARGNFICPHCGQPLRKEEGGSVRIVDGKADLESTKPRYACDGCGIFYRELLGSGYYNAFQIKKARKLRPVKELAPIEILPQARSHALCPRCGGVMTYMEGQPVRVVDGKADLESVQSYFQCQGCRSIFRRIAGTNYYHWSKT